MAAAAAAVEAVVAMVHAEGTLDVDGRLIRVSDDATHIPRHAEHIRWTSIDVGSRFPLGYVPWDYGLRYLLYVSPVKCNFLYHFMELSTHTKHPIDLFRIFAGSVLYLGANLVTALWGNLHPTPPDKPSPYRRLLPFRTLQGPCGASKPKK